MYLMPKLHFDPHEHKYFVVDVSAPEAYLFSEEDKIMYSLKSPIKGTSFIYSRDFPEEKLNVLLLDLDVVIAITSPLKMEAQEGPFKGSIVIYNVGFMYNEKKYRNLGRFPCHFLNIKILNVNLK